MMGPLAELFVRADTERAREELHAGRRGRCDALLADAERRLDAQPEQGGESTGEHERRAALRAGVCALRGQSLRLRGRTEQAEEAERRAVELFRTARDSRLSALDHGNFGMVLATSGDHREACAELELAVVGDEAPPQFLRELARLYLESGRPARADRLVEQALRTLPDDPALLLLRARTQQIRHNPLAGGSFVRAGNRLLETGAAERALTAFEEAARLHPALDEVHGPRAEALRLLGRTEPALEAFDRAVALDGNSPWLLVRRAAVLGTLGRWPRVDEDLAHALDLAPDDVDVLVLAGQVRSVQGQLEEAQRLAERALTADARDPRAIALGAVTRHAWHDLRGALALLRRADTADEATPDLLRLHARLALEAGERAEAVRQLNRLRGEFGADMPDLVRLATALIDEHWLDEAWSLVSEEDADWPDGVELRVLRVEVLIARGDPQAAVDESRTLIADHPEHRAVHLQLACALLAGPRPLEKGAAAEAAAAARASARLAPDWAEPWLVLARLHRDQEEMDQAEDAILQARDRDPGHRGARELLAEVHLARDEFDEAEQLAAPLLAEEPDDVGDLLLLARVHHARHQDVEALALLTRPEADAAVGQRRVEVLSTRADVRCALVDYAEATEDLRDCAELVPERAEIWRRLATVARLQGDGQRALDCARRARELGPDDPETLGELAAVHLLRQEPKRAVPIVRELRERWPDDRSAALLHAQLLALDAPERARVELARLAEVYPRDAEIALAEVRHELRTGRCEAALEVLDRLRGIVPEAERLVLRAEARRMLRRPEEALGDADRALALAQLHPAGLATLGRTLLDLGEDRRALETFERAVEFYPYDRRAQTRLGDAYGLTDRLDDAVRLLDGVAVREPRNWWALGRLADVLSDAGEYRRAGALYRRVCTVQPVDSGSWNGLGWCLQYDFPPDVRAAEASYQEAFKLDPGDLWTLKNLANIHHLNNRTDQARDLYDRVLRRAWELRARGRGYASLAAWCSFRTGDLATAARGLYEVSSAQKTTSSDHFDLALVHVCDDRLARGADLYTRLIPLENRHPWARRGLLSVARADLVRAREDFPVLAERPEIDRVLAQIDGVLATLPRTGTVRALGESGRAVEEETGVAEA